jgi:hypothetical protein
VRLTGRALVVAVGAVVVAAVAWPDGAERVGRGAIMLVGAAFVADLVGALQRALPGSSSTPFAPSRESPRPPPLPKGLVDLQRDIRVLSVDAGARRLPLSTRLRATARAGARARLRRHGLDFPSEDADDPEAEAAARALLGDAAYDFVTGVAPTVDVAELLAAVEGP